MKVFFCSCYGVVFFVFRFGEGAGINILVTLRQQRYLELTIDRSEYPLYTYMPATVLYQASPLLSHRFLEEVSLFHEGKRDSHHLGLFSSWQHVLL